MSYLADYVPPSERGVVFLSSVPRDMRPPEVCLHFNKFGTIHRHRFIPYPKKERRPGGPLLPLQYKEGWIEFTKADDARVAAAYMNTQPVDCKRTRKCYGQLWSVKYLEDFSWDTLLEDREGQRRARRMAEVDARRQERDANEAYRRLVMQAQQKKARRLSRSDERTGAGTSKGSASGEERRDTKREAKKAPHRAARGADVAVSSQKRKSAKKSTSASSDDVPKSVLKAKKAKRVVARGE